MATDPCAARAEQRSAFVDGALPDEQRERLLRHLVGCEACRAEVAELRRFRTLLRRETAEGANERTGSELSSRLVSIAGRDATTPLWARPFDRALPPRLPPSTRRARRVGALTSSVMLVSLAMAAVVVGWWAAPPGDTEITDPAAGSTAEFSSILTQMPLTSDALSAVLVSSDRRLTDPDASADGPDEPVGGKELTRSESAALLGQAVRANNQISHRGVATVLIGSGEHRVGATVDVIDRAGQGTELTVRAADGTAVKQGFVPPQDSGSGDAAIKRWIGRMALTGHSGAMVAGREATVVTATARDGSKRSWWVDRETGLLLWQESRDPDGQVTASAGFVTLTVGTQAFWAHLGPRLVASTTTAALGLDQADGLSAHGWFCAADVAGLDLVRLGTDSPGSPTLVHAVYSDGVSVVSVIQQHGRLVDAPAGFTRDGALWRRDGAGTRAVVWQSGDTVFTVVTNGSTRTVDQVVRALPHDPVHAESRLGRVHSGWVRILHLVLG